jgi:hypothetical protein
MDLGIVLPAIVLGCFFQWDPIRPLDAFTMTNAAKARLEQGEQANNSYQERHHFEQKFNQLIDALHEFTQEYNRSKGNVWPAKNVEAVNRAFRELERSKSWQSSTASEKHSGANELFGERKNR